MEISRIASPTAKSTDDVVRRSDIMNSIMRFFGKDKLPRPEPKLTPITRGSDFFGYYDSITGNQVSLEDKRRVDSDLVNNYISTVNQVPDFLERFHAAPIDLQMRLLSLIRGGRNPRSTYMFLKMIQDNRLNYRKVLEWKTDPNEWSLAFCDGKHGRPSAEFNDKATDLLWHIANREGAGNRSKFVPQNDARTITMLAMKHGESRVIEVIDRWLEDNLKSPFYEFCQIVENWETLKKNPLRRSLTLITPHPHDSDYFRE